MALISKKNLKQNDKQIKNIHNEVDCTYMVITDQHGNKVLQLDTYGSSGRKFYKVSQSIQFDEETGKHLLSLFNSNDDENVQIADNLFGTRITTNYDECLLRIYEKVKGKGFLYSYHDLANFYLALKSKPFVILAGVSGTGKSKLIRLFAEAVGATVQNGQFKMISVKPDWNDNTELFGYKNIAGEFIPGQLTTVILEAFKTENRNKPYFVCLDEMNLARVEYYLSDYLSLIESREFRSNEIVTDSLYPMGYHEEGSKYKNIYLPDNLYLIGTVNMDDTTHAFSRKVLDRANTIEFSQVNLEDLSFDVSGEAEQILQNNDFLKTRFLNISDALAEDEEYVKSINDKVIEINNVMKNGNRHFGYRVRDEIVFYMLENKITGVIEDEDIAFDYVIMQKVLPAILGSDSRIEGILIGLYNICNPEKPILSSSSNYINDAKNFLASARYKKSASKIIEMLRGYRDGFASFWN